MTVAAQLTDDKTSRRPPRIIRQIVLRSTAILVILILCHVVYHNSSTRARRIIIISRTPPSAGSAAGDTVHKAKSPVVTFVGYMPSLLEQDWKRHIDEYQKDPCTPLIKEYEAGTLSFLLRLVQEIPNRTGEEMLKNNQHVVLSAFAYSITTTPKHDEMLIYSYIEPLFGYFRHPYALPCLEQNHDVLDPSYLIYRGMPRDVFDIIYPGRKYLFDLGINGPNRSVQWLDDAFTRNGITFDEIWGWDEQIYNPLDFWSHVASPSVYTKLHLINIPVSLNVSDPHHPFHIIKSIYTPGDYIALKMDIDAPTYEQQLAQSFINDDVLSGMIGDFFYEKHMGALHFPHHGIPPDDPVHNMKSVIEFFTSLREKGIRAHYWV